MMRFDPDPTNLFFTHHKVKMPALPNQLLDHLKPYPNYVLYRLGNGPDRHRHFLSSSTRLRGPRPDLKFVLPWGLYSGSI